MKNPIWDIDDGDFLFRTSSNMAINSDGHMMMRMSDNMAMDMDSGDIHIVLSWSREQGDDEEYDD